LGTPASTSLSAAQCGGCDWPRSARGLPYLQTLVDENLDLTADILRWNRAHDIMMFRLTSDIVPFGSHPEVDLDLVEVGHGRDLANLAAGMRLSMHPGQFTVVSAAGAVWENSHKELEYHARVMDILDIDGDIVLHGGGVYGDRAGTAARIVAHIRSLPPEIHRRLRLENDERAWSVRELLPICQETGVPLIVDNRHHSLNGVEPLAALPWSEVRATWGARLPKLHYAEQDPAKRPGAHTEYLSAARFRAFRNDVGRDDVDVMLESKAKELALLRLREELGGLDDPRGCEGVACASC